MPKALLELGGMTLLERAVATLDQVCDEVVVTAPRGMALPVAHASLVEDTPGAGGPLAGLVAGLGSRAHQRALVLGVDFPFMRCSALAALLARLPGRTAVLPAPGGVPQPLAAAYGGAAAPLLAERLKAGERSVTVAASSLGPLLIPDAELASLEGGLVNFFNLNTPEDREVAERRLAVGERAEGSR
jgi:molybdopterin-guanine dinucleotide biosynthesis protein A